MWKYLDAAYALGCLRVLKNPKGNTRKFTFPPRHVLLGPGPIHDYSRQSLLTPTVSLPPDHQFYSQTLLIFPTLYSSISLATAPVTSSIGILTHHLIHFTSLASASPIQLPLEMQGFTQKSHVHPILASIPFSPNPTHSSPRANSMRLSHPQNWYYSQSYNLVSTPQSPPPWPF